jgi:hypothetical protein
MTTDNNLQFIREKIYQLRSAIMYSMSKGLVKIPNNIVTAIRVDDEGHLWFLAKRPAQYLSECEQCFPARLHFYRKGVNFFLEISGKATIVTNNSFNSNEDTTDTTYAKPVLIKMTMVNIEYAEAGEKKKGRFEIWLEQGYKWLARHIALPRHSKPILAKLHQTSI